MGFRTAEHEIVQVKAQSLGFLPAQFMHLLALLAPPAIRTPADQIKSLREPQVGQCLRKVIY